MEQIVPPRTSVATAGERVQLLKIFKGPCQHHLIFPLFWLKPCEGTGFSNLPPRVYDLSQEEVAIPKCQMLFFGDARNLLLAVRQAQVSDIYFYVFRRYLSLQWLSPPILLKTRVICDPNFFIPQSKLCAIIRCSHVPRDPFFN